MNSSIIMQINHDIEEDQQQDYQKKFDEALRSLSETEHEKILYLRTYLLNFLELYCSVDLYNEYNLYGKYQIKFIKDLKIAINSKISSFVRNYDAYYASNPHFHEKILCREELEDENNNSLFIFLTKLLEPAYEKPIIDGLYKLLLDELATFGEKPNAKKTIEDFNDKMEEFLATIAFQKSTISTSDAHLTNMSVRPPHAHKD